MVSLALSLIPAAINLVSGLFGKSASDKTAKQIADLKMSMPSEEIQAVELAREMSYLGMPGYEHYQQTIDEMMPKTISQAKEMNQSPSNLISLAAKTLTATDEAYNNLAVEDTKQRIANMGNYQNALMHKAGVNMNIQGANNQIKMASIEQSAQGTKDLLQSVNNAAGSAINTYGTIKSLNSQEEYYNKLGTFFQNGGSPSDVPAVKATPPVIDNSKPTGSVVPFMPTTPSKQSSTLDELLAQFMPKEKPIDGSIATAEQTPWGTPLNKNTPVNNNDWFAYLKENKNDPAAMVFQHYGFDY
jgi:hypothetical protein